MMFLAYTLMLLSYDSEVAADQGHIDANSSCEHPSGSFTNIKPANLYMLK